MTLADVNILLYAFRSDNEHHESCREWLNGVVNGEAHYAVSPQVLSSVVRIATHPKIYARPSALLDVLDFCAVITAPLHCHLVQPGPRHWDIFTRLCREANTKGSLVPDAWFAAIAIEWGCEWFTLDGDFARFRGLRCIAPRSSAYYAPSAAPADRSA